MIPLTRKEIEDIMAMGAKAFETNGKNPYNQGSENHRLWLRGYSNAKFGSVLNGAPRSN